MTEPVLRNIPDTLYERLKQRALENQRSLEQEIIDCLKLALGTSFIRDTRILLKRAYKLWGKVADQLTNDELLREPGRI